MTRGDRKASYGVLPRGAKCSRCRSQASVHLPSHHANFCDDCFLRFFRHAVERALRSFPIRKDGEIVVAVSGGKDSLALWSVLHELGYRTRGLHIALGIAGFSEPSREASEAFSRRYGLPLAVYALNEQVGYTLEEIARRTRRTICALCGSLKRHLLNRLVRREGGTIVATGHNLDDEASRLMGNILRHKRQYLERTYPFLPGVEGVMPTRMKPLFRLDSEEIRIYCRIKGITFFEGRCPFAKGATNHIFLEALDLLEERMPGTKRDFLFGYLEGKAPPSPEVSAAMKRCAVCGHPSYLDLCGLCRIIRALEGGDTSPQHRHDVPRT